MTTFRSSPIQAPPFPQSLELDAHTKPLFATDELSGPIDTSFKRSVPERAGSMMRDLRIRADLGSN